MNEHAPSKALATRVAVSPRSSKPLFKGHKQADFSDDTEVWKSIDGWPYEVSSKGRVRSLRLVQQHDSADGYMRVHFYDGQDTLHPLVHRLVAVAFIGPPPSPDHVVSHLNGDPSDNRPDNLAWATVHENAAQRAAHGNYKKGEDAINAKLTMVQAREIRRIYKEDGHSVSALARRFSVSRPTISRILDGRAYPEPVENAA